MSSPSQSPLRRHLTFANTCSLLALVVATSTGTAYAANTIRSKDIVNGQVRTVDLGGNAVTSAKIKDGTVSVTDLMTGAVDGSRIKDGSVTGADIADGALATPDLADGSVSGAKVADGTLGAADLATDSVTGSEVAANAIDGDEILNASLTSSDLAGSSVGTEEIAADAVTGVDVDNDSLTFSDIAGGIATGSISVNGAAVPVGRCRDLTVTIGGNAAAGDAAVLTVRADTPEGVVLHAIEVVSATSLRVGVCNFTGGAMPNLTDVPLRILTFR